MQILAKPKSKHSCIIDKTTAAQSKISLVESNAQQSVGYHGIAISIQQGFTLIEIAIVLVLMGLFLGTLATPLAAQRDALHYRDTRQALKEIREALIGYTLRKGHLPCPAYGGLANTLPRAGIEDRNEDGTCKEVEGVIPWVTLGVRELDAWGRRYTYRVTDGHDVSHRFARYPHLRYPPCPGQTSPITFGFCSKGLIQINTAEDTKVPVATEVVAVWVSHGRNQLGSWGPDGKQSNGENISKPEIENSNSNLNFVDSPYVDSPPNYDDLVEWLHPNMLIGRMVAAGRLP